MCAGNMATGVEKNDMTVGIPVSSGGISALCRMLCPAAFKQKSIKMKVDDAWKAEDFQWIIGPNKIQPNWGPLR